MSGSCSWKKWLLYAEEASSVCLNLCSFAGCLSHSGPIRGCQAKGPGFSFLQHAPDSLPHLVPWGELRAKFLKVFILPTQSIHIQKIPTTLFQLCAFPALFHLFFCSLKWWACYGWGNQASTSPWGMHLMQATLFFSFFYMGYLHLKMRGKKKKKDLGSRFQSSARIYANSPCLG